MMDRKVQQMFMGRTCYYLSSVALETLYIQSYFENASSSPSEISCLVFCSIQYKKNKNKRGGSPLFPPSPKLLVAQSKQELLARFKSSHDMGESGDSYYGEWIK